MSNRNKNNSSVSPIVVAAGIGLGALAAAGGYLFGRYKESCEAEDAALKVARERVRVAQPQPPQQRQSASGRQEFDEDFQKPGRDRECPICFREFADLLKSDEEIHTTSCGHVFCFNCIHKSLVEKGMCPVCRENIDPEHTLRIFL